MSLQALLRNINPTKDVVVSVCTFQTDTISFNVIPEIVTLKGTLRTFDKEVQNNAKIKFFHYQNLLLRHMVEKLKLNLIMVIL